MISISKIQFTKLLVLLSFLVAGASVEAASLSISPSTGVYTAGGTFTANVVVNTAGSPVNAAEGTISFSPAELSVVNVSRGSSIFNLWTQEPTFSNTNGTISFGGGLPSGYTGTNGNVMSVTFRALNAGTARVNFSNGSVLAADGLGTNVLTSMNGASFTVSAQEVVPEPETIQYIAPANTPAAPVVKSSTHPDPAKWYQSTTAELSWTLPAGVTGVRTLLDNRSGSIPTKVYDSPISSITLDDLDQGVSYFHIQFRNEEGWGRVSHYRLAVDAGDPAGFTLSLPENADLSNPVQTLAVDASDAVSEVRRFIIQLNDLDPFEYVDETGSSTIVLPALDPGRHTVIVEAFDQAGNSLIDTFSFTILAFDKPIFTDYPTTLNEGVIPVIKGLTRPNSQVEVELRKGSGVSLQSTVTANNEGVFTFIPDGSLSMGVYELVAIATDEYGAQSEKSDVIRIAVQQPGYIQVGSLVVSILSILVPLIALLLLLGFMVWYSALRFRKLRGAVRVESEEALTILKKELGEVRGALHDGESKLISSRKTKKLTKAETDLLQTLHAEVNDAESRVEKEIKDVSKLTNSKKDKT